MKTKTIIMLVIAAFISLQSQSQNFLNKPEHAAFDELNNRCLVTNYGNGTIVSIDSAGTQTVVKTGLSGCLGIHIIDTNVFISVGSQVKVFGLNSFNTIQTIDLAVTTWLDGMIEDTSGNLYVAENAGRIHKIRLTDYSDTVIINSGLPQYPQDLAFDKAHNRLLLVSWQTNSAITAIDLNTNQISSLIPTTSGQYDGIVMDNNDNIYVTSWLNGGRVYKWAYPYTGPVEIISQGHSGPAGLAYHKQKNQLIVPNFNTNSLSYIPLVLEDNEINILIIMPHGYGANYFFLKNHLEEYGWNITYAGITDVVQPCGWAASNVGSQPFVVDTLLSEITDISSFHGIAIMAASGNLPNPYGDLLSSQHTLNLIHDAANLGIAISATCGGVRVLAAADVINGKNITGKTTYLDEYLAAGAIFLGEGIAPVIDGNIITSTRGQYYNYQCAQAIATVIENNYQNKKHITSNPIKSNKGKSDIMWSKTFGASASEGAKSICKTPDGGYVIAGYTYSYGKGCSDIYLLKTNANGAKQWEKTYGGSGFEYANSCIVTDDGYVIAGYTTSSGAGSKDAYIIKTDLNGNLVWTKTFGGTGVDVALAVVETSDSAFILCGHTESSGNGEDDVYLVKFDSDGDQIWSTTFGGSGPELGKTIIQTSGNNFMICGGSGSFGDGNMDIYLIKIDGNGNEIFTSILDYEGDYGGYDIGNSIIETADGSFLICGSTNWQTHSSNLLLAKTDSLGQQLWVKVYENGIFYLFGNSALQTNEGDIVISANTMLTGKNDYYLIIADSMGNAKKVSTVGGDSPEWINAITLSDDKALISTGHTYSYGAGMSDFWLVKSGILYADVFVNPSSGHAPLNVNFTQQSSPSSIEWNWDFNNDGTFDSDEQNPTYTYTETGNYDVALEIDNGFYTHTQLNTDFIRVFDGESAIESNGESSKAFCQTDTLINFTRYFTFEAWLFPYAMNESNTYGYSTIMDKSYIRISFVEEHTIYADSSLGIYIYHQDGTTSNCWTPQNSVLFNQWQHIAVTYNADVEEISVYINGIKQTMEYQTLPSGWIKDNGNKSINFCSANNGIRVFNGIIDEIRLWNAARTEHEIQLNMNHRVVGSETGLAANWRMDEGSGDTLHCTHNYPAALSKTRWIQGLNLLPPLSISDLPRKIPQTVYAYPNPVVDYLYFVINSTENASTSIEIFNLTGHLIHAMTYHALNNGKHTIPWDCKDMNGKKIPSGVYYCKVTNANTSYAIAIVKQ